MNDLSRPIPTTVTRRGLVRTAAWTVPVVTLASAAPAFAASNPVLGELRVNVVEASWRDVTDEYVRLRLSVTNLSPVTDAGALALRFTFRGPWVRWNNGTVGLVNVNATAGGTKWGGPWLRTQSTIHSGTGDTRQATTIFTLPSSMRRSASAQLDLVLNSTNPRIYGDTTPIEITPITVPSGFTMAATSATKIVPTT